MDRSAVTVGRATNMQELIELINEVRANKGQEAARVADGGGDVRLREDLGFDSMDLAELTVRIEERFGVDVFADGVVHTVGEVDARIRAAQPRVEGRKSEGLKVAVARGARWLQVPSWKVGEFEVIAYCLAPVARRASRIRANP